jgi:REP element-mobilizing transposase RayT
MVYQGERPLYFITFNTHFRARTLKSKSIHKTFLEFCRNAPEHGFAVGRYVIMPDHIHLFVGVAAQADLSRWMQALKSVLGKTLSGMGIEKPHWQEGFFDHLLRSSESYEEKWEYVRQNPVRKGLCATPEEWPYQGEVDALRWL